MLPWHTPRQLYFVYCWKLLCVREKKWCLYAEGSFVIFFFLHVCVPREREGICVVVVACWIPPKLSFGSTTSLLFAPLFSGKRNDPPKLTFSVTSAVLLLTWDSPVWHFNFTIFFCFAQAGFLGTRKKKKEENSQRLRLRHIESFFSGRKSHHFTRRFVIFYTSAQH